MNPAIQPAADTTTTDAGATLIASIRALATASVSPEQVRDIVAEEIGAAMSEIRVTQIEIKVADRQAIKIDGVAHHALQDVLTLCANRIPTLLVGPAGCGKSHLASQVAGSLGLRFASISCSAGMTEGHLTGRLLPTGAGGQFEYQCSQFVDFYEHGGVFLLDEIDAADANTLLVINQATANGHMPVPNRTDNPVATKHGDFVLVAAANTFGTGANRLYVGRNQLDESTLDRFRLGQILMDYDENLEDSLVSNSKLATAFRSIRASVATNKLRRVVSTRAMIHAQTMMAAGWSLDRVTAQLTSGWSQDECSKCRVKYAN